MSFMNQALKGVPQDHYRHLLGACQRVTADDILSVMQKYLLPIFHSDTSVAVVVSAPGKVDEISEVGLNLGYRASLTFPSHLVLLASKSKGAQLMSARAGREVK
jgi:hypothetical protein